ncbi:MAG: TonB-dependent receptor [Burkholderiales bacterium]
MNTISVFVRSPLSLILTSILIAPLPGYADEAADLGTVEAQSESGDKKPVNTNFDNKVLTTRQKLDSSQEVQTVSRDQVSLFGPDAGGMQALGILPNVMISGYNASSVSSRSTISMRGVKVGWNSVPGDLETNGITAELDGIPLNSLSQGTGWHSPEIPIGALMQGTNVVEGPGNPDDRWYNSLGGTINFIPVQPTKDENSTVSLSYGSFDTGVLSVVHNTGEHDGWSTVFGAAAARSQAIRTSGDNMPSKSNQGYFKTIKELEHGSLSFGVYSQYNDEYRPNMIPVADNSQIHIDGLNGTGTLYSQQSSGFYSTLPRSVWFKNNSIENDMAWSRLYLDLTPDLSVTNSVWVRDGNLRHFRVDNFNSSPQSSLNDEYYTEHSRTFGDKLSFAEQLDKHNVLEFGGYIISSRAEADYLGYAPPAGTTVTSPASIGYNTTQSTDWALFMQDNYKPVDRLLIVPGIRLVGFQTNFYNNSPAVANNYYPGGVPATTSFDTNPNQSTNFVRTEPSLGLNYELAHGVNLYGDYAIARRNPTSGNYDKSPEDINALKPILSQSYDLGTRFAQENFAGMQSLTGSLGYFHTLLDNQTIARTLANNPLVTTFGYGSATMDGFELELEATVNDNWSGFLNMGWLTANWNSYYSPSANANFNGLPVSNSPTQTTNAGVTYRAYIQDSTIETTLWDQYFGQSYLYDNATGAPSNLSKPAYNLVNLSIVARTAQLGMNVLGIKPKMTSLSLQVMNLLNEQYNATEYISSGGYFQTSNSGYAIANPGAPRSIFLTLTSDF